MIRKGSRVVHKKTLKKGTVIYLGTRRPFAYVKFDGTEPGKSATRVLLEELENVK